MALVVINFLLLLWWNFNGNCGIFLALRLDSGVIIFQSFPSLLPFLHHHLFLSPVYCPAAAPCEFVDPPLPSLLSALHSFSFSLPRSFLSIPLSPFLFTLISVTFRFYARLPSVFSGASVLKHLSSPLIVLCVSSAPLFCKYAPASLCFGRFSLERPLFHACFQSTQCLEFLACPAFVLFWLLRVVNGFWFVTSRKTEW